MVNHPNRSKRSATALMKAVQSKVKGGPVRVTLTYLRLVSAAAYPTRDDVTMRCAAEMRCAGKQVSSAGEMLSEVERRMQMPVAQAAAPTVEEALERLLAGLG